MTAKEKSELLIKKFTAHVHGEDGEQNWINAKLCALIAANEVIQQWEYVDTYLADLKGELNPNLKYWYNVKQEIEKL